MVTQADVDELQIELEQLRAALLRDRDLVRQRIDDVIARTRTLREASMGGKFEPAVRCVHDLLISLNRGLNAQANLQRVREA